MTKLTRQKNSDIKYWLLIITSFLTHIFMTGSKHVYTANKTTFYSLGT